MAKSANMNIKKEGHHHATEPAQSSSDDIKDKRYSLNDKHGASTSFRNIGFCRWGKDWLPIIQLGPMDVEPGSVRDMWYDMYHSVSYSFLCTSCVHAFIFAISTYIICIQLHYMFMFIATSYFHIIFI